MIPNMKNTKKQSRRTFPNIGSVSRSNITRMRMPETSKIYVEVDKMALVRDRQISIPPLHQLSVSRSILYTVNKSETMEKKKGPVKKAQTGPVRVKENSPDQSPQV
uniref:Uncharacterized protein n=1 Tax=Lepeophtheirus salmonis TaxID=72036 RepID=A0A0K2UET8_LEPSM